MGWSPETQQAIDETMDEVERRLRWRTEAGGDAFPWHCGDGLGSPGMTLLDYFAAQAMQAEISSAGMNMEAAIALAQAASEAGREVEEQVAFNAYAVARAMLKARDKQQ